MKTCSRCRVEKSLDQFYPDKRKKDGLDGRCKDCVKAYKVRWHEANPGKNADWSRDWREKNPERRQEILRAHSQTESFRETQRRYRQSEKGRLAGREHTSRYTARKRSATVGVVDYDEILERDGLWCYLCESEVSSDDIHFDHVVPLSKGGEHSMENIRVTHSRCNMRKNDRLLEDAA